MSKILYEKTGTNIVHEEDLKEVEIKVNELALKSILISNETAVFYGNDGTDFPATLNMYNHGGTGQKIKLNSLDGGLWFLTIESSAPTAYNIKDGYPHVDVFSPFIFMYNSDFMFNSYHSTKPKFIQLNVTDTVYQISAINYGILYLPQSIDETEVNVDIMIQGDSDYISKMSTRIGGNQNYNISKITGYKIGEI